MTDRPSDHATAQAFREWMSDGSQEWRDNHPAEKWVPDRAREIDAAAPKIDPDKYPSTRPADQLPADVLIEVAFQSAGRAALYDNAIQHSRLQECRAELLRRLAAASDGAQAVAEVTGFRKSGDRGPVVEWAVGTTVRIGMRLYTVPPSQDAEDAARYRWLRARMDAGMVSMIVNIEPDDNDEISLQVQAAIDAARAARGGG